MYLENIFSAEDGGADFVGKNTPASVHKTISSKTPHGSVRNGFPFCTSIHLISDKIRKRRPVQRNQELD